MRRTTFFLPDDLERTLEETARREGRPQAELVREALSAYLHTRRGPRPRSVGIAKSSDRSVDSENVKEWLHAEWDGRNTGRRRKR
jgi:predicted transcriptional regulator